MLELDGEEAEKKPRLIEVPEKVRQFFPESKSQFPNDYNEWKKVRFIAGKTLFRSGRFHKALILVQNGEKLQFRLYGWRLTKEAKWWHGQTFSFSVGTVPKLISVLDGFQMYYEPDDSQGEE